MKDNTYKLYNDPNGIYTMNCTFEKVIKKELSVVYHLSFKVCFIYDLYSERICVGHASYY